MTRRFHLLVDIGHPGDVHVFHDPIRQWQAAGHRVSITTSDKDVSLKLLEAYGLPYHKVGVRRPGLFNLASLLLLRTGRIVSLGWRDRPDILLSISSATMGLAAFFLRRPHIAFDDSEFGTQQRAIYQPFTARICTPEQFMLDLGPKQVRYKGFKELAYLHPSIFQPKPEALRSLGLDPSERLFLLRGVAWDAAHDFGERGLSQAGQAAVLKRLGEAGRVIASYEGRAPLDVRTGRELPPEVMLHLLAHCEFILSEGLTMVTEAALLGTPALLVNTLQAGNMKILRDHYGLIQTFSGDEGVLAAVEAWLAHPNLKAEAAAKRERLLAESVNVSQWMVQFVEDYLARGGG
jgi:hypothetical protein